MRYAPISPNLSGNLQGSFLEFQGFRRYAIGLLETLTPNEIFHKMFGKKIINLLLHLSKNTDYFLCRSHKHRANLKVTSVKK